MRAYLTGCIVTGLLVAVAGCGKSPPESLKDAPPPTPKVEAAVPTSKKEVAETPKKEAAQPKGPAVLALDASGGLKLDGKALTGRIIDQITRLRKRIADAPRRSESLVLQVDRATSYRKVLGAFQYCQAAGAEKVGLRLATGSVDSEEVVSLKVPRKPRQPEDPDRPQHELDADDAGMLELKSGSGADEGRLAHAILQVSSREIAFEKPKEVVEYLERLCKERSIDPKKLNLCVRPEEKLHFGEVMSMLEACRQARIRAELRPNDDGSYRDKMLTNDELGNDPDLPTNYKLDRIADIEVPRPEPKQPAPKSKP